MTFAKLREILNFQFSPWKCFLLVFKAIADKEYVKF